MFMIRDSDKLVLQLNGLSIKSPDLETSKLRIFYLKIYLGIQNGLTFNHTQRIIMCQSSGADLGFAEGRG